MSYLKGKKNLNRKIWEVALLVLNIVSKLHFQLHSKSIFKIIPFSTNHNLAPIFNGKRLLPFYKNWSLSELGNRLTSKIKHYRVLCPQTYRWGHDSQEWLKDQYKYKVTIDSVSVQVRHCVGLNFYFPEWNSLSPTILFCLAGFKQLIQCLVINHLKSEPTK